MNAPVLHLGIAGAGLVGRLLAHRLSHAGHRVSVFARSPGPEPPASARAAASFAALGFLGRHAEAPGGRPPAQVLQDWQQLDAELDGAPGLRARGTLRLGPLPDERGTAAGTPPGTRDPPGAIGAAVPLSPAQLARLEPRLGARDDAWLLTDEALVDAPATLRALHQQGQAVQWHWGCAALAVEPGALALAGSRRGWRRFDAVFDSRGPGAGAELALQPLRHERLVLALPGHGLGRAVRWRAANDGGRPAPVRVLRPLGPDRLALGCCHALPGDRDPAPPLSLARLREHLDAACALMPSLAHASLLDLGEAPGVTGPQGQPWMEVDPLRVRINGLGAEGWRHAPGLVDEALARWAASRDGSPGA